MLNKIQITFHEFLLDIQSKLFYFKILLTKTAEIANFMNQWSFQTNLIMMVKSLLVVLSFVIASPLVSEIELVTISWTPLVCQPSCAPLLKKSLEAVRGVESAEVIQPIGQANLKWKKNSTFSYEAVDAAMRMIGVAIWNIRVTATGSLQRGGKHYYLVSSGDHTRFELLSPVTPFLSGQTPQYNEGARALSPFLQRKLMEGVAQGKIITIAGPLFMPWRHPSPSQLVVDQITFTDPEKKENESNGPQKNQFKKR